MSSPNLFGEGWRNVRDRASLLIPWCDLVKNGAIPQPFWQGMAKRAPQHFLAVQGHWAHFISFCFVCGYLWQHENIEFYHISVYEEIKKDACGDLRLWTFWSHQVCFCRYWGPYDAKVPLTAHAKCLYDEWLSWCRWMRSRIKWIWMHFVLVSPLL